MAGIGSTDDIVAVCSRSFSRHDGLRSELVSAYPKARFNHQGVRLAGSDLVDFLTGASKAIVALERIDAELLKHLPALRVISKFGVGLDSLDLDALDHSGVELGWTGGVNRRAVAELVIAQCINLLRNTTAAHQLTRTGAWTPMSGRELGAMTVGIIGFGHVGKEVARLLGAFGSTILSHDIRAYPEFHERHGVAAVDLETLLSRADIVSLHVPFDASTRNLLSADRLSRLRDGAFVINTARGGLVDESALFDELASGRLGGAAFDVLSEEPPMNNPLLTLDNFLCTPHLAGSTSEALISMGRAAIHGLDDHHSIALHRTRWSA